MDDLSQKVNPKSFSELVSENERRNSEKSQSLQEINYGFYNWINAAFKSIRREYIMKSARSEIEVGSIILNA